MTQPDNARKANGHAGPHGGPNGHGPATTERGGVPAPACPGRHPEQAASDDTGGSPSATAAAFAAAASKDRQAYAAAAPPPSPRESLAALPEKPKRTRKQPGVPGGELPLPANAGDFVEEIHRRIDLFEVWQSLLRSKDEKVKQRAVERLTDLCYKIGAASADEPQQFIFDLPRPKLD